MSEPIEVKSLPKEQLNTWLANLNRYNIYGPVDREEYTEFAHIKDPSELDLTIRNTFVSPKRLIFSQTKNMIRYDLNKDLPEIHEELGKDDNGREQLLIGIRPCDAHGFAYLDPTFDAEFKDPYYLSKRKNTTLIGLACNVPDMNCFCSSVGGGPFDTKGLDILMVDLGSTFILNIYTDKGKVLVESSPDVFTKPSSEQLQRLDELQATANTTQTRKMETDGKPEKLGEMFESDYWDNISKKCLGCGICTYLCPTCYCFDITDEKWGTQGVRVRTWDSCMYPEYTVHASGYNPRPARMNRLRNRVYHKFKYYPELYDIFGCTGCGRCIRHCPVNIDIIDIINFI